MSLQHRLISTIIATYNRPALVTRTLDNLIQQTYRPLEVVVVDDGSSPATEKAIRAWHTATKPDIRLIYRWQENQGPATARNYGLEACSGELIHFLDDDDLLEMNALEYLAAAQSGTEPAIAMASYQYWEEEGPMGTITVPSELSPEATLAAMIEGAWFVPIHGYLFKRAATDRIGPWNPALTSQEDDEYLLRAALSYVPFKAAPGATVYYCQHEGVRRATPGKPGESLAQGLKKRMSADLAIRESAFEVLYERGQLAAYRTAFLRWRARLRDRYASIGLETEAQSELLSWLSASGDSLADGLDQPPSGFAGRRR